MGSCSRRTAVTLPAIGWPRDPLDLVATSSAVHTLVLLGFVWCFVDGSAQLLSPNQYVTASHFAGLILRHEEYKSPLLYQQYGHVILAEPNPVLLYQISPTETRVLVDTPSEIGSQGGDALVKYFMETVAPQVLFRPAAGPRLGQPVRSPIACATLDDPLLVVCVCLCLFVLRNSQLPAALRTAFVQVASTEEAVVMPNRACHAAPVEATGAILLGDAWNTRHPLTGSGMSVCLRDVELITRALQGVDLRNVTVCLPLARRLRLSQGSLAVPSLNPLLSFCVCCGTVGLCQATNAAIQLFVDARKHHSSSLNVLANALHKIFTIPTNESSESALYARARLRDACFSYLAMGGPSTRGPVGLLSAYVVRAWCMTGRSLASLPPAPLCWLGTALTSLVSAVAHVQLDSPPECPDAAFLLGRHSRGEDDRVGEVQPQVVSCVVRLHPHRM
jgi:squalene monooxygenase